MVLHLEGMSGQWSNLEDEKNNEYLPPRSSSLSPPRITTTISHFTVDGTLNYIVGFL